MSSETELLKAGLRAAHQANAGKHAAMGVMHALPDEQGVNTLLNAGVTPMDFLTLLWQYGPAVITFLVNVVKELKAGGFTWAAWQAEFDKYSPKVMELVQKVAAALGITLPAPPVSPIVP